MTAEEVAAFASEVADLLYGESLIREQQIQQARRDAAERQQASSAKK